MLLNTITVVGTGEVNLAPLNRRVKTSRNCSSRVATWRISFSPALPTSRKFFERTLVQLSFACAVKGANKQRSKTLRIVSPQRLRTLREFVISLKPSQNENLVRTVSF